MLSLVQRLARRLLLPTVILLALWGAYHVRVGEGVPTEAPRMVQAARILAVMVLLLAWRLRRGRIALALLGLGAATEALRRWPVAGVGVGSGGAENGVDPAVLSTALGVSVLLPVTLLALAWLSEWWVISRASLVRLAIFGTPVAALWGLAHATAEPLRHRLITQLANLDAFVSVHETAPFVQGPLGHLALPELRIAWFALAALGCLAALGRRDTPLEAGLLVALVPSFAMASGQPPVFHGSVAVLLLGTALVENARRLAFDDGLTGLPARRALDENLAQMGSTYALAMVDLDRFKLLNDRHGHEVGDQVLRKVAARLARVGGGGSAFRYGGEEFTLLFPGKDAAAAEAAVDAVRRSIADAPFTVRSPQRPGRTKKGAARRGQGGGTKTLKVTISAGVAARSDKYPHPAAVLKAADKALYTSKKKGRNRVTVAR